MKTTSLLALAVLSALTVSSAFGQGTMMSKKPMHHSTMKGESTSDPMMGLSSNDKKTAMRMMAKMTPKEKAAMGRAGKMCMMQGKMGKPMMAPSAMMMSMSKSDQVAMKSAMKKMTPAQHAVAMKMMANCHDMGMMKKG